MMERTGPDSLEGLFIALLSCLISTLMYGASGLSSMLFVASITRYDTDRNKASFPFILSTVLQAVSGPFAGYFAKRFNIRVVVLAGSFLGFLGIGACFFAEDITTVTILWGIIFGTGFGLSSLLLPAIINQYFVKNRSIAMGMCYLGSPVGFFIFPPIFEVLCHKYGLSGTFLILSGINLNCVPLSMLLREPKFKTKQANHPLNYGKKSDSYSSTDFEGLRQISKQEYENKDKSDISGSTTDFCARRHSIEFLWKQFASTEHLICNDEKYVLSLNKTFPDKQHNNNGIMRSFKKTSKNHYRTVDKSSHNALRPTAHSDSSCTEVQSKFGENNMCLNATEILNIHKDEQLTLKVPETFTDANFNESAEYKNINLPLNQEYEEVSTIYFGTDLNSANCESHTKDQSNHTYMAKIESGSCCEKPGDIKNSDNKTSKLSNLVNYKQFDEFLNQTSHDATDKQTFTAVSDIESGIDSQNSIISMYLNPIFILMCIVNSIVNLHFTVITTVVIDFSRDLKIEVDYEKYIMMCLSLTGAFGMLGFGWITDNGYMSRTKFGSLAQLICCVSTIVLPFTVGFETLMIPLAVWGMCQSSVFPLIPAIIADYFVEDMQSMAISACNVLCGPLYLIIPPLIGYFRDNKGSYDNIFFLLGILAFLNSIAVVTIPALARWRAKK